ncbi:hypothetical protein [uncultured Bacteroides sp.]|uniref:hypothetical protein n=1 Tax=uncultured Bacteroides sp. TaxID=162156 RepID=UPI00280B7C43|nr:hypothetical protein [uncultured Bacteroides sp.]
MNSFLNFIKTVRKGLLKAFILSILYIIIYKFFLIKIDEIFAGASIWGEIFYDISFAYVTGFMFHLMVVHYKEWYDQKCINKYVLPKLDLILGQYETVIKEMCSYAKIEYYKFLSDDDFKKICEIISGNKAKADAPLILGLSHPPIFATWNQYCINFKNETTRTVEQILSKFSLLDSDLVLLLSEIEDSKFFNRLRLYENLMSMGLERTKIGFDHSDILIDYTSLMRRLEIYSIKKKKIFNG